MALVKAQPFNEIGGNLFLCRPALWERSYRNVLEPRGTFADLAAALDAEVVRDHATRDDRLTEPPARLDHELVRPCDRVPGEHHARAIGIQESLHHDTHTRTREAADALAVRDRRIGIGGPPDLPYRGAHIVDRGNIEQCQVLPGEAGLCTVFVSRRGADCKRAANGAH